MRILLVEESINNAQSVSSILQQKGFDVLTVHSGQRALELLKTAEIIDLVISDVVMSDIDGLLLLKYIRNSLRYKNTPVILTSEVNDQKTIIKAMKLGISGYLVKPVQSDDLIKKVDEVMEKILGAILVVDDEEIIRSLLRNVLERDGFRVETAIDGVNALEVLAQKKIELIISDIMMPNMSGTELLVEVKENFPHIPMILITGQKLDFSKKEAISSGADDYICKPFKNIEIINRIRACLMRTKKAVS